MSKPKILIWDIETLPNIVTSWGLWVNGALNHDHILQERTILCASWKWLGEKEVHTVHIEPAYPHGDYAVVEALHEVVSSADAIVHHHGDNFDLPWLRTRIAYHGLRPLPPVIQIDTRKIAKKAFYFNSNKLDYLAKFLGIGKKIKTELELWKRCMNGDEAAIQKMVRYNKRDVLLLEKVYKVLTPHIPAKLNQMLFTKRDVCQHCGSKSIQYRGFYYTRSNKFHKFQCKKCGTWSRSLTPIKEDK